MKRGAIPNHKALAMTGKPKPSGAMAKGGSVKAAPFQKECNGGKIRKGK